MRGARRTSATLARRWLTVFQPFQLRPLRHAHFIDARMNEQGLRKEETCLFHTNTSLAVSYTHLANEIVLPLAVMMYTAAGQIVETDLLQLGPLLRANGWTGVTALCTMLFSLMHWPCSTTMITIYKETRSVRWTVLAAILPTLCGAGLCMLIHACV